MILYRIWLFRKTSFISSAQRMYLLPEHQDWNHPIISKNRLILKNDRGFPVLWSTEDIGIVSSPRWGKITATCLFFFLLNTATCYGTHKKYGLKTIFFEGDTKVLIDVINNKAKDHNIKNICNDIYVGSFTSLSFNQCSFLYSSLADKQYTSSSLS